MTSQSILPHCGRLASGQKKYLTKDPSTIALKGEVTMVLALASIITFFMRKVFPIVIFDKF